MQAIGILGGIDALQHRVFIEVLGQRQLHDVPGAGGILVELINRRIELFLRHVSREIFADGVHPDLLAIAVLHLHIRMAGGIISHQHRSQTRGDALLAECLHAGGEISEDLIAVQFSIQGDCSHEFHYSTAAPAGGITPRRRNRTAATPHTLPPRPRWTGSCFDAQEASESAPVE